VVTILGAVGLVLLGFAAWLGKLVVDGNLIPHSITYHMFSALGLVAIFAFLVARLQQLDFAFQTKRDSRILWLGGLGIGLLLVQIALGTEVREEIDAIALRIAADRSAWIDALPNIFKIHRTFSLGVLGVIALFAFWVVRTRSVSTWPRVLLVLVCLEILAGMGLAYLGMPAILQPVHLMFAVLTFTVLVMVLVMYHRKTIHA
jgi:cytochrome c oxidase assembly protein subunit 15